ncbi:MAG: uroporphyrinogen-III C-methyltransferase [Candidatus Tectomicrobia bacterium]|nr:uroporphyrinogen-III C-methyltransferase [Candidatus Tectomicrobia bacterium]
MEHHHQHSTLKGLDGPVALLSLLRKEAATTPGEEDAAPAPGIVSLVGAGPGDPKLLTLRALELLQAADVIAYDELVPPAILALASPAAELLPVGRRCGAEPRPFRLHPAVAARAHAGKRVVRLKAGDPFLFGRGGEEIEELVAEGIPFEVVPGVSAAFGAAASAGIPLTHRDCASAVTFTTGHGAHGEAGDPAAWQPAGGGTIVLYMVARKLRQNVRRLIAAGRSPETPAAYVAAATTAEEVVLIGTLADIAGQVEALDSTSPALLIVGEVVRLRQQPAARRTERSPALAAALEDRG